MASFSEALPQLLAAQLAAFGRIVTYVPAGGSGLEITAIYRDGNTLDGSSPGVLGVLRCAASDFAVPPERGDMIIIGTLEYSIADVKQDQVGAIDLGLVQRKP